MKKKREFKFLASSLPQESKGLSFEGIEELTVPHAGMSLAEILQRFVRKEKLQVGHEVNFHETDYDLEKLASMDLVDREEFIARQKSIAQRYERQEKAKAQAEAERIAALAASKKLPPEGAAQS